MRAGPHEKINYLIISVVGMIGVGALVALVWHSADDNLQQLLGTIVSSVVTGLFAALNLFGRRTLTDVTAQTVENVQVQPEEQP